MPDAVDQYNFSHSRMKGVIKPVVYLGLLALAGTALENNAQCRIVDLQAHPEPYKALQRTIDSFSPTVIGITFSTLLYHTSKTLVIYLTENYPNIPIIAGGASSFGSPT